MAHLKGEERARYVRRMFAGIAGRYDLMNRVMTAGQDVRWRRYVVAQAALPANGRLLDIATGTGDIALEAVRQVPSVQPVGGDFTLEMMQAGKLYPERQMIQWVGADTLALPFPTGYFDAVTSGFLMRNVIDVEQALREQMRVLKPGMMKSADGAVGSWPWFRRARRRFARASSSVVMAPPSPVVSALRGWKLKQPITPIAPACLPCQVAPSAHAASSTSGKP